MEVRTLDVVDVAAEVVAEASADGIEGDFGAMPAVEVFFSSPATRKVFMSLRA